ncbi:MAG: hypothetical protein EZS28_017512 [Streblomastix strix]|uniref:Protein kinase domain-containing protein n=1 Tax=Streblomastix strix TaxID=222440 RepID=A0A5J4VXE9_9EUKA|nr:MAG: hypothetical protein EZS28_017512 [Streblomastix strix]
MFAFFSHIIELSRGIFERVPVVKYMKRPDVELMKCLPYFDAKNKKAADGEIAMLEMLQSDLTHSNWTQKIFIDKDRTTKIDDFGLAVKMMNRQYFKGQIKET